MNNSFFFYLNRFSISLTVFERGPCTNFGGRYAEQRAARAGRLQPSLSFPLVSLRPPVAAATAAVTSQCRLAGQRRGASVLPRLALTASLSFSAVQKATRRGSVCTLAPRALFSYKVDVFLYNYAYVGSGTR